MAAEITTREVAMHPHPHPQQPQSPSGESPASPSRRSASASGQADAATSSRGTPAKSQPGTSALPSSQTPGHPSFRRQRASRACETCHARKVRCDAASLGVPCTNCVAFSIECKIPAPKRKKPQSKGKDEEEEKPAGVENAAPSPTNPSASPNQDASRERRSNMYQQEHVTLGIEADPQLSGEETVYTGNYAQVMKPKFVRAPIKEAGRVAYLGESSNLSLLVHDRHGTTDVVHYPLPENIRGSRARLDELDNVEIDILHQRGAFLLPPRVLCDELVEAFFTWVAPVVPVVNRVRFMRRYRDSKNPPSLLLLQAILLAGSRVCSNPQLMDSNGSTTPAAVTFYKRAKALYDANYEDDRVTIVQSLILMGWYWEGPEDVTKNVFYWTRVATIVAQGSGMHRSVEASQLPRSDKRLWKRIWWTLFTRDRSVAVALGRPCGINTEDSDVEILTEDDFIEEEVDRNSDYAPDPVHVQFFLNYVKLCEITGLVLSQQYSAASQARKRNALDLTHSDMALADWLQNCPPEVKWDKNKHHFWSALLHCNYYTTLCLLHRAHMPPAGSPSTVYQNGYMVENSYPSRNIAATAAHMITSIVETLRAHDQIRYTPAFIVYSLFSALIMHVYQMRSSNSSIVAATEKRMASCMTALKEVSKVWLVAKMVHTLFESILGNKVLEERLQRAAGNRHKSRKASNPRNAPDGGGQQQQQQQQQQQHHNHHHHQSNNMTQMVDAAAAASKRKFDEVDSAFPNGTGPVPPLSYERSRPQTPAMTPSRELPAQPPASSSSSSHHPNVPHIAAGGSSSSTLSPHASRSNNNNNNNHDVFMGTNPGSTRNGTRAGSPANGHPFPGTPPEFYLVTRNSPPISENIWNNFQPNDLFPNDATMSIPSASPSQTSAYHESDVNMNMNSTGGSSQGVHQPDFAQHRGQFGGGGGSMHGMHGGGGHHNHHQNDPHGWSQLNMMDQRSSSSNTLNNNNNNNDDTWSNSSMSNGPAVPTTLNVQDWFQFFGMNGDVHDLQTFSLNGSGGGNNAAAAAAAAASSHH